jgi:hypothetical protein
MFRRRLNKKRKEKILAIVNAALIAAVKYAPAEHKAEAVAALAALDELSEIKNSIIDEKEGLCR